ncbi:histone-binding protein N1/N2-like [Sphaeramia orbicularis]|uniref:histone-binding protein N1/N2-like n=1 Tax=Sphaeramia orbicularis TaxID=375764 RepID=UPI00118014B0|nr:histone-binding protein N1/N2-like [Sphaeramia orbicularis]
MEEANKLIALGKKHLQEEEEVMKAVDVLQEACSMLAKQFGEKADECGQAYYWYAVALLEQERMENRVLGNALAGICVEVDEEKSEDSIVEGTEKLDEETMDELRAQVYDAMAEREGETSAQKKDDATAEKDEDKDDNAAEKKDEDSTAEKDREKAEGNQSDTAENDEQKTVKEEDKDKVSDGTEPNGEEKEETKKEAEELEEESKEAEDGEEEDEMEVEEEGGEGAGGNAEGQDGEDTAGKESDDEVENLQLAWEMLELAKIIYKRKDTKEDQLMLSQIHLKLGEVSAESGNCKDAKEDFNECLNLQLKHLEPDSRLLAETYYNLGLLYTNISLHEDAAESLSRSIAIINTRLENLQKLIDNAAGPEDLPDERQEMANLQSLLPDIKTKEAEAIHNAKMAKMAQEPRDEGSSSSAGPATQNRESTSMVNGSSADENPSETQATDISHLVRKKRKPESPKQCVGKKAKQDETHEDEEPHTSGTQGQSSGTQGQNQTQSSDAQSNGPEGQSGDTQNSGTQGQGSGTQNDDTQGQGSGTQSNGTEGQNSGTENSETQSGGACNETQGQSSGTTHEQSNGPLSGPHGQSNGTHGQGNGPLNEPQGQSNGTQNQSNGPHNGAHGQSSSVEGEGN